MAASASLMLHLTGRCNLECRHCYMEGSFSRKERLPFDWIAETVTHAPAMGIGTLFLTGGEPMMFPHFTRVLRLAAAVEGLQTTVCTNATLLRKTDARQFAELGVAAHVSIDGTPHFHDDFRAMEGAFALSARGVALLVEAGVPVTIVTTVCAGNIDQFDAVADWAIAAGAGRLLVQPLLGLGRGRDIDDQKLSSADLVRLILKTLDLANGRGRAIKASIIGGSKRLFLEHPCAAYVCNGGGCHRGVQREIKKIVVRENGIILPEATNLHPSFAIGHVGDGPLRDQVRRFFADGYAAFDRLARATYDRFVPDWPDPLIPWDELLAAQSRTPLPWPEPTAERGCGGGLAGRADAAPPRLAAHGA